AVLLVREAVEPLVRVVALDARGSVGQRFAERGGEPRERTFAVIGSEDEPSGPPVLEAFDVMEQRSVPALAYVANDVADGGLDGCEVLGAAAPEAFERR